MLLRNSAFTPFYVHNDKIVMATVETRGVGDYVLNLLLEDSSISHIICDEAAYQYNWREISGWSEYRFGHAPEGVNPRPMGETPTGMYDGERIHSEMVSDSGTGNGDVYAEGEVVQ